MENNPRKRKIEILDGIKTTYDAEGNRVTRINMNNTNKPREGYGGIPKNQGGSPTNPPTPESDLKKEIPKTELPPKPTPKEVPEEQKKETGWYTIEDENGDEKKEHHTYESGVLIKKVEHDGTIKYYNKNGEEIEPENTEKKPELKKRFLYEGYSTSEHKKVRGKIEAPDEETAIKQLEEQHIWYANVKEEKQNKQGWLKKPWLKLGLATGILAAGYYPAKKTGEYLGEKDYPTPTAIKITERKDSGKTNAINIAPTTETDTASVPKAPPLTPEELKAEIEKKFAEINMAHSNELNEIRKRVF